MTHISSNVEGNQGHEQNSFVMILVESLYAKLGDLPVYTHVYMLYAAKRANNGTLTPSPVRTSIYLHDTMSHAVT